MIKKIISAILVVAVFATAFAQNQNNQWRFGTGGGISFTTNPPSFVSGASISTPEGSASIANRTSGALLFYTDGVTVWNSLNQVMANGTGLRGGSSSLSSTTAAVIIPKPLSTNLYYIVTVDEQFSAFGVRYSVVDMSLNGGLGGVLSAQKNILLLNTTSEKLEVVPAADGQSYWLLTHDEPGNDFYAYRVTSAGIQTTPVISSVGSTQGNGAGHMKINRQFNKIAIGVTFGAKMELLDFDNATGIVSNPISWNTNFSSPLIYGIEFSPNGNVLYVSNLEKLVQYDLTQPTAAAIQNSAFQVSAGFYQPAALQLGKDDKIYITAGSIDAIACPNALGDSCGFQQNVIAGQTGGGGYGLPKWVYYPDDVPVVSTNSITQNGNCQGLPISFSLQNTTNIVSVSWHFGDPASGIDNSSSSLTPQHTYAAAGTYTMNVIINYECFSVSLPLTVTINPTINPTFNTIPTICSGDTPPILPTTSTNGITGTWSPAVVSNTVGGTYTFTPNTGQCTTNSTLTTTVIPCANNQILYTGVCHYFATYFSLQNTASIVSVNWNFGESSSGVNNFGIGLTPVHQYSNPGSYLVTASVVTNTGSYTVTETIQIQPTTLLTFGFPVQYLAGSAVPNLPATSNEGVAGTWSPSSIDPINSGTYVFTPAVPGCFADNQVYVSIVTCITPTFTPIIKICPNTPAPSLPTTSLNGYTGIWSPSVVSNTASATYTFIPSPGQNACSGVSMYIEVAAGPPSLVLQSASSTLNQTLCVNEFIQTITIELGGAAVGASAPNFPPGVFGSISGTALTFSGIVLSGANSPYNYTISTTGGNCGNDSISGTITVLPLIEPTFAVPTLLCAGQAAPLLPTTSTNGITGSWSPNSVSTTVDGTYTFTPNPGQCADVKVLTISVNNAITTPIFTPIPAFCEGTAAPILPTISTNGITGTWFPALVDNSSSAFYTFTANAGQCTSSTPIQLNITVNPSLSPTFAPIPSFCAGTTAPNLPATSSNGLTGTWFPALVDNNSSGIYTFTPDPGTCVNTTPVQITINVDPVGIPTFAAVPAFCSGTTAPTLPTTSLNGFSGLWVPASVSNVSSGSYTFTPTAVAGQCLSDAVLSITVLNQLAPNFVDLSLCQNQIGYVLANQSPNGITGTWSPATIDFTTGGNYTFTPNSGQCSSPQTIAVSINLSNLNDFQWVVSAPFSSNATITVIPNSPGNYLYQLDLGAQQTSNIFQNVSAGLHSIQVVDANGCSNTVIKEDILIIDYPKFFTPNDDGFTDTWNISGLQSQVLAKIFIYDRFGKLIKQISPSQTGWDGTYNNRPLPADDYWFVVEYEYNNSLLQFKSHFSLKR